MTPLASEVTPVPSPTFTPALQPPPGVVPNPNHPASLVRLADIAIGICTPLVTIFFLSRSYVRFYLKRVFIFEDVIVTIAWAGTIAYCGIMRATMSHHGGEHGWDISISEARDAAYWFNVAAIEYGAIVGVTKTSVLWLYRRVFSPVRWSIFDLLIVFLIVLMVGFYGSITIVKIFQCNPREKIWNSSVPGHCIEINWILNISGGFNAVTDFMILFLPIYAVRKLQMSRLKRVFVVLAFTFGLCAPIFATIGFVVRIRNSDNKDTTWKQPEILLWGAAELATGNLCASFPELAVLFKKRGRNRSTPRRPTDSEIRRWNESNRGDARAPSDPYFPKSLMSTIFSVKNDGTYIELQEQGHNVQVISTEQTNSSVERPDDGVVVVRSEVRVDHR